jgi:hypothetical protein
MRAEMISRRIASICTTLLVALVVHPAGVAAAPSFELGGGLVVDALGSYDVGEALGGEPAGNDLGPGRLGGFVYGGIVAGPSIAAGLEGGAALGGLVGTDERYFGGRSNVGSTLSAWLRTTGAWKVRLGAGGRMYARAGVGAGIERLAESTGAGGVHVDSIIAGPWVGLDVGAGITVQLHADLHVPVSAGIDDMEGDPDGSFVSGGVRVAYLLELPRRRR